MAIFRLQINSIARSAGRSATAAAAYRSGERIRDERTKTSHNYSRRQDVVHAEIFLPSHLDSTAVSWARNRERLWNTAEHIEKRHNSRVAREYQVILPSELNPPQRLALARAFSREIADRYKVAVDLAVHDPRPGADPRNFHAHLLTTTREVTPAGLGAKTGLDMRTKERRRWELPDHPQEFVSIRERWATLTNEALKAANVAARVDHRSLAAQGVNREPLPSIPIMHLKMEQRGLHSPLAEKLRTEYRERVQRRQERALESGLRDRLAAPTAGAGGAADTRSAVITDPEEIRRQAREAWLQLRSKDVERTRGKVSGHEREVPSQERESDLSQPERHDDLAL
jgi:ATP-dependent exoDNAse (exonuclease V) alpha subunit